MPIQNDIISSMLTSVCNFRLFRSYEDGQACVSGHLTVVDRISPQTIVFDDVKLNSASAYNPNHGVFTAPETGI